MERVPVRSSNVAAVGYDEGASILEIEFHSGSVYAYRGVPELHFQGLVNAGSVGGYFHKHIRDRYPYRQLR